MLIIQLCTLYANFHTDLCALISPKLFGNSKKKRSKKVKQFNWEKQVKECEKNMKIFAK